MRRIGFVRLLSRIAALALVASAVLAALLARIAAEMTAPRAPIIVMWSQPTPAPAPVPIEQRPRVRAGAAPDEQPESPAAASAPQSVEIRDPVWLARPRHPERRYPAQAFAAGVEGQVELDCLVGADGRLACEILSETPPDWGFGAAALELAGEHVMEPPTREGLAAIGHYRMRIPFQQAPQR